MLAEEGKYAEAIAAFTALGDYEDSADQAKLCRDALKEKQYNTALDLIGKGGYAEALEILTELGDYSDSAAQITLCNEGLKTAEAQSIIALAEAGKYSEALEALSEIDDSATAASVKAAIYDAAVAQMEAQNYDKATEIFGLIEDFSDSSAKISACEQGITEQKYQAAKTLMDNGRYAEAKAAFAALNGYADSEKQISICDRWLEYSVGNTVVFGRYEQDNITSNGAEPIEWIVLDVQDGDALLISKYVLEVMQFASYYANVNWKSSLLRAWLNGSFYNAAFYNDEKKYILTTVNEDNVFELTTNEFDKYYTAQLKRSVKYTQHASAVGSAKGVVTSTTGTYVSALESDGSWNTYYEDELFGIMPSIWVKIVLD